MEWGEGYLVRLVSRLFSKLCPWSCRICSSQKPNSLRENERAFIRSGVEIDLVVTSHHTLLL